MGPFGPNLGKTIDHPTCINGRWRTQQPPSCERWQGRLARTIVTAIVATAIAMSIAIR
jgi:hypothetical protein